MQNRLHDLFLLTNSLAALASAYRFLACCRSAASYSQLPNPR
jgi:hypothetical protein